MAWYHWIAVYSLIIGAIVLTIIPDKPWWLWLSCLLLIGGSLLSGVLLPHKEDPAYTKMIRERESAK
ncbi:hypothetical protein [Fictibacillus sp. JL2B1089]|uniref:hypothetical protein n=1 Tax=Fictibacillus sp. JL2B1089 TaxID=3399565 RepID=UPI003A8893EC